MKQAPYSSRTADKFVVRLPDGMRERIGEVARSHRRSMNSEIIARLHAEVVRMMALPEMRERLAEQGLEPVGSSPAEADRWIRTQSDRWGKVIRAQKSVIEQQ